MTCNSQLACQCGVEGHFGTGQIRFDRQGMDAGSDGLTGCLKM